LAFIHSKNHDVLNVSDPTGVRPLFHGPPTTMCFTRIQAEIEAIRVFKGKPEVDAVVPQGRGAARRTGVKSDPESQTPRVSSGQF
jgi:hypothetical protein